MYWAQSGQIKRQNLDGLDEQLVLSHGASDIALDLANGKIYSIGSDWIRRANLDGSGEVTLVTGLSHAGGIALDLRGSSVIPEPSTLVVWSVLGCLGLAASRLRRRKK